MPVSREHMHVRVSPEARNGWEVACHAHGVTLTGLIEALGRHFAHGENKVAAAVIREARQIDRTRLSRRPSTTRD